MSDGGSRRKVGWRRGELCQKKSELSVWEQAHTTVRGLCSTFGHKLRAITNRT